MSEDAKRQPVLAVQRVSRFFGGVQALLAVSMTVEAGTVHGLMGPNGAGKTTLLNLISGVLRPDEGSIALQGRSIEHLPAYRIARLGVRRTYQNIRLFAAMSGRENVLVGLHSSRTDSLWRRLLFLPDARLAERRALDEAGALLERVGIGGRAWVRAGELSYGEQRRLEIARALASRPLVLLLDEPTAGMNAGEAEQIGALVRSVANDGTAVLLVEHNVELVMAVSDVITVLNFGRVIASGTPNAVRVDKGVIAAYLGSDE